MLDFQFINTYDYTAPGLSQATEHTFEDVSFGSVDVDREIIVTIQTLATTSGSPPIHDYVVEIGDDLSPVLDAHFSAGSVESRKFRVYRAKPTGTIGDVKITLTSGTVGAFLLTVYRAIGPLNVIESNGFESGNLMLESRASVETVSGGVTLIMAYGTGTSHNFPVGFTKHRQFSAGAFGTSTNYSTGSIVDNSPNVNSTIVVSDVSSGVYGVFGVTYGNSSQKSSVEWTTVYRPTSGGNSSGTRENSTLRSRVASGVISRDAPFGATLARVTLRGQNANTLTSFDKYFIGNASEYNVISARDLKQITFSGNPSVDLPQRGHTISDPFDFVYEGFHIQSSWIMPNDSSKANIWGSSVTGGQFRGRTVVDESSELELVLSNYTTHDSNSASNIARFEMGVVREEPSPPYGIEIEYLETLSYAPTSTGTFTVMDFDNASFGEEHEDREIILTVHTLAPQSANHTVAIEVGDDLDPILDYQYAALTNDASKIRYYRAKPSGTTGRIRVTVGNPEGNSVVVTTFRVIGPVVPLQSNFVNAPGGGTDTVSAAIEIADGGFCLAAALRTGSSTTSNLVFPTDFRRYSMVDQRSVNASTSVCTGLLSNHVGGDISRSVQLFSTATGNTPRLTLVSYARPGEHQRIAWSKVFSANSFSSVSTNFADNTIRTRLAAGSLSGVPENPTHIRVTFRPPQFPTANDPLAMESAYVGNAASSNAISAQDLSQLTFKESPELLTPILGTLTSDPVEFEYDGSSALQFSYRMTTDPRRSILASAFSSGSNAYSRAEVDEADDLTLTLGDYTSRTTSGIYGVFVVEFGVAYVPPPSASVLKSSQYVVLQRYGFSAVDKATSYAIVEKAFANVSKNSQYIVLEKIPSVYVEKETLYAILEEVTTSGVTKLTNYVIMEELSIPPGDATLYKATQYAVLVEDFVPDPTYAVIPKTSQYIIMEDETPPEPVGNIEFEYLDTIDTTFLPPSSASVDAHTWNGVPFGDDDPDREIIIVIQSLSNALFADDDYTLTNIGSDTSPVLDAIFSSGTTSRFRQKVYRAKPSGTTGSVSFTSSGGRLQTLRLTIYRAIGPLKPIDKNLWNASSGYVTSEFGLESPEGGFSIIAAGGLPGSTSDLINLSGGGHVIDSSGDMDSSSMRGYVLCASRKDYPSVLQQTIVASVDTSLQSSSAPRMLGISYGRPSQSAAIAWTQVYTSGVGGNNDSTTFEDMTLRWRTSTNMLSNIPAEVSHVRITLRGQPVDSRPLTLEKMFVGNAGSSNVISANDLEQVTFKGASSIDAGSRTIRVSDPIPLDYTGSGVQYTARTTEVAEESYLWTAGLSTGANFRTKEGVDETEVLTPTLGDYTNQGGSLTALVMRVEFGYGEIPVPPPEDVIRAHKVTEYLVLENLNLTPIKVDKVTSYAVLVEPKFVRVSKGTMYTVLERLQAPPPTSGRPYRLMIVN